MEKGKLDLGSPGLEWLPLLVLKHGWDAACVSETVRGIPCNSFNHIKLPYLFLVIRVPYWRAILQVRSDRTVICFGFCVLTTSVFQGGVIHRYSILQSVGFKEGRSGYSKHTCFFFVLFFCLFLFVFFFFFLVLEKSQLLGCQLRMAMHHHPLNQERALNLSILTVSGPGEFSRVEPN